MSDIARVSVHGCHSREFCGHAADLLEDILEAYADQITPYTLPKCSSKLIDVSVIILPESVSMTTPVMD